MAATKSGNRRRQLQDRSFWFCFAGLQLCLCATMAPLCWLVLDPSVPASLSTGPLERPLGVLPAVIVTTVGAGFSLVSVALICLAKADATFVKASSGCPVRILWLRIFTAGAGFCAQLAAVGLLLHAASQLLYVNTVAAAASVAALAGLAAVNASQAMAAFVHIYNCVTAVQLIWRIAFEDNEEGGGEDENKGREKLDDDKRGEEEAPSEEVVDATGSSNSRSPDEEERRNLA